MLQIGLPNGDCVALGGYNVTSDCNSLGNYAATWPSSWQSSNSGVFEAFSLPMAGGWQEKVNGRFLWSMDTVRAMALRWT